jgi:lysophospholipase L1-like esterase
MPEPTSEFAEEFRAFAMDAERRPPPREPLLFYGSSSIRFWTTLDEDFPGQSAVNRGFGGSTLAEAVCEMPRLVFPLKPRAVVLYSGENDLDQGASPERLHTLFKAFANFLGLYGGPVPFVFISIKPSPARAHLIEKIRRANALIREETTRWPHGSYLDVFDLMLDAHGNARHELFSEDCLHMSRTGYHLWTARLRHRLEELKLWR